MTKSAADLRGVGALVPLAAALSALAVPGLAACGGSLGHELEPSLYEGGTDGEPAPVIDDAGAFNVEASPERRRSAPDSALDASAARDVVRRDATSPIRSGTHFCETSRECFGLTCEFGPTREPGSTPIRGICVARCMVDEDCDSDERCLTGLGFGASCLMACDSPSQCALGFDCFDYRSSTSSYTCVPTSWTAFLPGGSQ